MRIHLGPRLTDLLRQPVVIVIATAVSLQTLGIIIVGFSITCWALFQCYLDEEEEEEGEKMLELTSRFTVTIIKSYSDVGRTRRRPEQSCFTCGITRRLLPPFLPLCVMLRTHLLYGNEHGYP